MGGKKKKKGKKKKAEKKEGDDDDEVKEEFVVKLPNYGWIRLHLKLCDPPSEMYNSFRTIMRSNHSMMDVKKRIIDYHGRIENINMYNTDPYPPRNKQNDFKRETKPRVPPYSVLEKLLALKKEKEDLDEKEAVKAKKLAAGEHVPDEPEDVGIVDKPDPKRFDVLNSFDFPEDLKGGNIVLYDSQKLTLFDIFENYGTEAKPKEDPRHDPEPPKPKEKVEKLQPSPTKKKEEEEAKEEGDPDQQNSEARANEPVVEEEPEEVFIPPVEKVLWYDFDTFDGKDPVLLALMHRGINDTQTI